ncbi:MAG: ABC transporter ATP-binding protein [Clostridia bacterium]|nr:ABC transporter ATP-binding protein [Clostridia bacterium]
MKVAITKVGKDFKQNGSDKIRALDEITLTIQEGDFACLLGPSGCGKSTLLNIIAGLDVPDQGTLTIDGQEITGAGPERGMVFQEAALFPWLTVRQNVEFGLKMAGIGKKERHEKALHYLQMVHLGRFTESYPHQLSGGMKQRVAIARALVMDPKILLMDEPFAALDAQTRSILHTELQEIWSKTGKTIIFVTHNVSEAVLLGNHIFVFSSRPGRIKKDFRLDFQGPRSEGDSRLLATQKQIMKVLREEIEKVAREELEQGAVPLTKTVLSSSRFGT